MEGSGPVVEGSGPVAEGSGGWMEGSGPVMEGRGGWMEGSGPVPGSGGWFPEGREPFPGVRGWGREVRSALVALVLQRPEQQVLQRRVERLRQLPRRAHREVLLTELDAREQVRRDLGLRGELLLRHAELLPAPEDAKADLAEDEIKSIGHFRRCQAFFHTIV